MDPVDQPGPSKPKPDDDPALPVRDGDVEKTLETLQSMTATLVTEVGSPTDPPPAAPEASPPVAASPEAEVEQEIHQAIRQLQDPPEPAQVAPAAASPVRGGRMGPRLSGLLRLPARPLDGLLVLLASLAGLLDMPFRWMPAVIKQLLGYVAVGTALMAAALWYYIINLRPH